jgi:hypothetical protein
MKWQKLGLIYEPRVIDQYLLTHAANPLPIHIENNIYRIFFNGRDYLNRSSVGFFDFDFSNLKVNLICNSSIFNFGEDGSFYSHGVSLGNSYRIDDRHYIGFMGWNIKPYEHWRGDIGRIRLDNLIDLKLAPKGIFIGTDSIDKLSLSYPYILYHESLYKMWYGSTVTWDAGNNEMLHVINYAISKDGDNWEKMGLAIPFELGVAQAFSRPTVIIEKSVYHMWYSYRSGDGTPYRIGYSRSEDGKVWERRHEDVGIDVSTEGWDSQMICYPQVFKHQENYYMLYNGNDFGKSGIGLAILENGF